MGNFQIRRHRKLAFIGVQLVAQQRKQAGFAGAIGPGQTDLLALMDGERSPAKQHTAAAADGNVFEIQHSVDDSVQSGTMPGKGGDFNAVEDIAGIGCWVAGLNAMQPSYPTEARKKSIKE